MNDEIVFNRLVKEVEKDGEVYVLGHITKMIYHTPYGVGDSHFVDIYYDDGEVHRVFKPDRVVWSEEGNGDEN